MTTPTRVDIGTLIYRDPEFRSGRPCIAGTGMSVHAVAELYIQGMTADEIAAEFPDIPRSHIHAAVTYYVANQAEIDGDLAEDDELHNTAWAIMSLARMLTGDPLYRH